MALPEKEYFTVPEMAERWECDIQTIEHYFEIGDLVPAIKLDGIECEIWKGGKKIGDRHPLSGGQIVSSSSSITGMAYIPYYNALKWHHNRDQRYSYAYLAGEILSSNPSKPEDLWFVVSTSSAHTIIKQDLLITLSERALFEQTYGIGRPTVRPSYSTPEIEIMYEAIEKFWLNYNPLKPPRKPEIVRWLVEERGLSNHVASVLDTMIRPLQERKGGNKPSEG